MQYFQNIYFPLFDNIVEGTIIPALIKYSIYVLFIMHYLSQACHNPKYKYYSSLHFAHEVTQAGK